MWMVEDGFFAFLITTSEYYRVHRRVGKERLEKHLALLSFRQTMLMGMSLG
jgi:hypothetical protein